MAKYIKKQTLDERDDEAAEIKAEAVEYLARKVLKIREIRNNLPKEKKRAMAVHRKQMNKVGYEYDKKIYQVDRDVCWLEDNIKKEIGKKAMNILFKRIEAEEEKNKEEREVISKVAQEEHELLKVDQKEDTEEQNGSAEM